MLIMVSCQKSVPYDPLADDRLGFANDSVLVSTNGFYDSVFVGTGNPVTPKELAFQRAKIYYYKALIEENDLNQHEEAFSNYLNSLWVLDGLTGKRRVFSFLSVNPEYEHFTALVYNRLAWFFYTYDAWDVALECLESSNECFEKENNLKGIASNYELMGDVMLAQGDRLEAMSYYKKSDDIYERLETNDNYRHFSSLYHHALDLYNTGESHASYDLLLHALEITDDDMLRRKVYFGLGYLYYETQQYDSALYNYEKSYPLLPRQTLKSYCRIIKSANILGDSLKSAHYAELLSDYFLDRVALSGFKARIDIMYEDFKAYHKELKQNDIFNFVMFVVVLLLIILAFDSILIERRRRSRQKEIEAHEKVKALLEEEILTTKTASRNKEEKIKSLEIELKKTISNPDFQKLPFDKKLETLFEMPICKRVCLVKAANVKAGVSYPEMVLSENQTTTLVNAVDAVFPKFSVELIKRYPRLKRFDVVYCCMYILGITEVQAAALTGKTYQAVWTRSMKLHEIFENDSNLQLLMHDLLKHW